MGVTESVVEGGEVGEGVREGGFERVEGDDCGAFGGEVAVRANGVAEGVGG